MATSLTAALVAMAALASCSADAGGTVTEDELQAVEDDVRELGERVDELEQANGSGATVDTTEECVAAARDAQEVIAAIDDIAEAARALDAARLNDIVRSLQPLEQQLEDNLSECQVDARIPSEPSTTPSSPPASPTD
jgi:tetrahydromethanopterin S-methyltransferase subunit B